MRGLASADRSAVRDIVQSLTVYVDGGPSGIATVRQALSELMRFEMTLAYGVEEHGDAFRVAFCESVGARGGNGTARDAIDTVVGCARPNYAGYDLRRPEVWHRNRAITKDDLLVRGVSVTSVKNAPMVQIAFPRLGIKLEEQIRVLVCDGPSLLAWVGGYREEPYTRRDRRVLEALTPALRRRLLLERNLAQGAQLRATLDTALEVLAAPAFVVTLSGAIVFANTAGRSALDKSPAGLRTQVMDAVRNRNGSTAFRIVPVTSAGTKPVFLVIARAASAFEGRVLAAAGRWRLSPRQREVLALLAAGSSNARIAAELSIADRTVETHVTAILARAQVPSRAALIAAVLSDS